MNVEVWALNAVIIVGVCVIPPSLGLLFHWLKDRSGSTGSLSLKQLVGDFCPHGSNGLDQAPGRLQLLALANLLFALLALGLLALRQNLLPAVYLQALAALSVIAARLGERENLDKKTVQAAVRDFLWSQTLLISAVVGFFWATGSFTPAHSLRQPGTLLTELPFLIAALVYAAGLMANPKIMDGSDRALMLINALAAAYRWGFFLLLAGFLTGGGIGSAIFIAICAYAALSWTGPRIVRWLRRYRLELRREIILAAVVVNLAWLYIKYI